jgi:hypothetical protein
MHVALGWEYRGRRVHQGPVIYCALEGQTGIEGRIEAWRLRHLAEEIEDVPFYLQPVTLDLINQHQELIDLIRGELGTEAPAVVVIDTLNRSLHGSESSDEDMGNYIRAADAVRDAFDCAVIIVHHCGHNGDRPRGHSSQIGAAEAVIGVRKESAGQIIATVEKMKDGPNGETIASRLDGVVVGEDEDGEEITSCVVVPIEWIPPAKSHKTKLGPKEQIALKALQYAISETGEPAPSSNHIPDGTNVVTRECWSGYAIRKGISDSDQPRAKNQAFKRAVDGLLAKGCVGQWGDLVWPIT